MTDAVLEVRDLRKAFGDVVALDGVSLRCGEGEVHAVLGENGAGKSTLMHVVCGLLSGDGGEVSFRGGRARWESADEAREAGIAMVHQHFMLVPTMTVAENIALARRAFGFLDREENEREVRRLAEEREIDIGDPGRRVEDLSVGEQQRVEILKALVDVPALLILDEPTAVLTPAEVEDLFALLRELARKGTAIAIVTHKLAEVVAIADQVTVLRRGAVVGGGAASSFDERSLAELMVGERPASVRTAREAPLGNTLLEVSSLRWKGREGRIALDDVSFEVRSGEVLVVAGVEGNGQQELLEALAGVRTPELSGEVRLAGEPVTNPGAARRAGLAIVPADRRRDGLVGEMALWENLLLRCDVAERAAPRGWLSPAQEQVRASEAMEEFSVRPAQPELPAAALSGGNQQRLILARELTAPGVAAVAAANPTRGLDLVAMDAVHARLRRLAAQGAAVVVLSTDLDEVEALADRVLVLYRGRLRTMPPGPVDRTAIGRRMAGLEEAP